MPTIKNQRPGILLVMVLFSCITVQCLGEAEKHLSFASLLSAVSMRRPISTSLCSYWVHSMVKWSYMSKSKSCLYVVLALLLFLLLLPRARPPRQATYIFTQRSLSACSLGKKFGLAFKEEYEADQC